MKKKVMKMWYEGEWLACYSKLNDEGRCIWRLLYVAFQLIRR